MTKHTQPQIFILGAFDGSRLASFRSLGHQIRSQGFEQLGPELLAFLFGPGLTHRVGKLAQRIQSTFEADALQRDRMFGSGLGHGVAEQVVCEEMRIDFSLDHLGRATAEQFHFQSGFEIIQAHL